MESKKLLGKLILMSLILCNFTYSYKRSDEKTLLEVFEQQELAVIAQNSDVLIYQEASQSWLISQKVETEGKVIQAKLTQKNLALLDDQNTLTLYKISDENTFRISLKKKVPALQLFNINEKAIIGWTQTKEVAILHFQDHDDNIQIFEFSEQEILNAKICQNEKVLLRSQTTLYFFNADSSSRKKQIFTTDGKIKSWGVDENCSRIFILQDNSIFTVSTEQENEKKSVSKKIMISSQKNVENLQVSKKGSLLTVENEEFIYVYKSKQDEIAFLKAIRKQGGEAVERIYQESLLIKFGEELFSMETVSEKKKMFQEKQKLERILEESLTSQFELKQNFSFEQPSFLASAYEMLGLRVEKGHILFGSYSSFSLYIHDGSQFTQKLSKSIPRGRVFSAELDAEREWLFIGDTEGQVMMYAKEGEEYTEKTIFTFESNQIIAIDVNSNGYMAAATYSKVFILKWNGETFESVQNISRTTQGRGIKMCSDNTLLLTVGNSNELMVYRNISSTYTVAQNESMPDLGSYPYVTATDDCRVVLTSVYQGESPSKFVVYIQNQSNLYQKFTEKTTENYLYNLAGINNAGDMLVFPGKNGVDVWRYSHQDEDYVLTHTYDLYEGETSFRDRFSAAIDDEYIVYEGLGSKVADANDDGAYFARYTWEQSSAVISFGNKDELVINELENPIQLPRQVTDLDIAGDRVLGISKYSGAFLHSRSGDDYSEEKSFMESRFFSSLDMEAELGLVVLGSYSRQVHVHQDTGSGFSSVQNISTTSQVLKVSVNGEAGKLLVGTMSGDLISYSWDSQTNFTSDSTISNLGARVYGLKTCNDGSFLALLEVFGWFVFKAYDADGTVTFDEDLEEFMEVQMAATDDCSTVVFSNTLLMQVVVYRKSEGNFVPFRTIAEDFPLSAISIHPDGDMFVVARHTQSSSALYKYNECIDEFEAEVLEGTMDHQATAITASQVALGGMDGSIQVFDYQHGLKTCDSFGKKTLNPITSLNSVTAERAITAVAISAQLVAFVSLYNGFSLYSNNAGTIEEVKSFPDHHFISSITIQSSLQTLAVGSLQKRVLVYKDNGSGFDLNETISTESQVLDVDLSQENKLVVGMMNGDVAEYSSDGESFTNSPPSNTTHSGSRVYGVKACGEGKKVVMVERQGVFKVVVYASDWSVLGEITTHLEGELIEPHLATTPNCEFIAVSGITLSKVHVFTDSFAQAFHTIHVDHPISSATISPDGDLIVVGLITSEKSLLYQYESCSKGYTRKEDLQSGSYDEAVGVSGNLLVQGNEDGTVKVSEYSWVYNPTCPTAGSLPARVKSGGTPSTKLSSLSRSDSSLNDVELLLLIGGCVVFLLSSCVLVYWILNQNTPTKRKAEEDPGTEAGIKVQQV